MAQSSSDLGSTQGCGSAPTELPLTTRKKIGKLLDSLVQDHKFNPVKDGPIDCFFFQIQCPIDNDPHFSQISDVVGEVKQIKDKISDIAEKFFMSDKAKELGNWYKIKNGWTLTYFLDAQAQAKIRRTKESWSDFEKELNTKIRLPLREQLKEIQMHSGRSIRLPVVFMRVCKYTKPGLDDSDVEEMEVDDKTK